MIHKKKSLQTRQYSNIFSILKLKVSSQTRHLPDYKVRISFQEHCIYQEHWALWDYYQNAFIHSSFIWLRSYTLTSLDYAYTVVPHIWLDIYILWLMSDYTFQKFIFINFFKILALQNSFDRIIAGLRNAIFVTFMGILNSYLIPILCNYILRMSL
jgi:hypothetical protein